MTTKVYDCAVKTGEYEKDGQTKGRYQNVGSIFKGEDGTYYMLLDRTFNPAGLPNPKGSSAAMIGLYPPKPKGEEMGAQ